ncbi:DNA cytosine methyltransferase [Pannonibacter carbonis]|uniref:DNA cytosine methyltransferase n=1 Tax=Pannonibacter carbonis TaxID=2067569 RepID=UPI000D0EE140|nr:DNA cytosine methyltransferase [Pannonibacter carbonis]
MALHPEHDPSGKPYDRINGLSLCTGVGGLELGLHIAEPGYRTACYVEREAGAAATLVARMEDQTLDNAPVWDDVRTFDGRPWRGRVHILSAGYPCQPFSSSGRRRGKDDPRHLWPDVARIIEECAPEWVFCENVEGHLDRGFEEVAGELSGLGFGVKAGLFSAAEVGASHIRNRLFILAHADDHPLRQPGGDPTEGQPACFPAGCGPDRQPACLGSGGTDLDAVLQPGEGDGFEARSSAGLPLFAPAPCNLATWDAVLARRMDLQPEFFGLDHGMADRLERYTAAGNGVVPLAAAYAYRTLKAAFEG